MTPNIEEGDTMDRQFERRCWVFGLLVFLATAAGCADTGVPPPANAAPAPECRMSSNGTNVCGYNCQYASNGDVSCASRPDGHCAFNSDGSLTCP